jgi:30S ribosomal protein S31
MGRGDRRTTKGKISAGSFGISRPQKVKVIAAPPKEKAAKSTKKK